MASKALQIFFEGDENQMKVPEDKKPSLFGGLFKDMGPKVSNTIYSVLRHLLCPLPSAPVPSLAEVFKCEGSW